MKNETRATAPQKKKKNYVAVGQKTVRERGINRVSGGDLLELAKEGVTFAIFLEHGIESTVFTNTCISRKAN